MKLNITIGDEVHKIERLTLGDLQILANHFDLHDLSMLGERIADPRVVSGLVYIALKTAHPTWEHERLVNEVNDIDAETLGIASPEAMIDPKADAASAATPPPATPEISGPEQ
jgi:hypothetical protein